MPNSKEDKDRDERISMEIVVDAYDREERVMGWYYYLESTLQFPFTAICIKKRSVSPIKPDATVEVVGMGELDDCAGEMFVEVTWEEDDRLSIPLAQLMATPDTDEDTQQAIEDWHYWVERGYQFG